MENKCGVQSVQNALCRKCRVWKYRVWKMWSVENAECAKRRVWKCVLKTDSRWQLKVNFGILSAERRILSVFFLRPISRIFMPLCLLALWHIFKFTGSCLTSIALNRSYHICSFIYYHDLLFIRLC